MADNSTTANLAQVAEASAAATQPLVQGNAVSEAQLPQAVKQNDSTGNADLTEVATGLVKKETSPPRSSLQNSATEQMRSRPFAAPSVNGGQELQRENFPKNEANPSAVTSAANSPWDSADVSPGPSRARIGSAAAHSDAESSESRMPIRAGAKQLSARPRAFDEAEANPDLYGLRRSVSILKVWQRANFEITTAKIKKDQSSEPSPLSSFTGSSSEKDGKRRLVEIELRSVTLTHSHLFPHACCST